MTPNILKGNKDTSKFAPDAPDHVMAQANDNPNAGGGRGMDADHSTKTMESGANMASGGTDMTEGLHETAKPGGPAGDKATGHGTSMFSAEGALGKHFTPQGSVGGTAESIGGPLSSQGAIGKQFTTGGSVGSTFQNLAKKNEQH